MPHGLCFEDDPPGIGPVSRQQHSEVLVIDPIPEDYRLLSVKELAFNHMQSD
jgi:hypothetical protein